MPKRPLLFKLLPGLLLLLLLNSPISAQTQPTIFDFRVAYLIAANAVPDDSPIAPANFEEYLGAVTINSWSDFIELNEEAAFHALLLHPSLAEEMDTTWLAEAYRNNDPLIIGINMRGTQLAELIRDPCAANNKSDLLDYFENAWLQFTYEGFQDARQVRPPLEELIEREHCPRAKKTERSIFVNRGFWQFPIGDNRGVRLTDAAWALARELDRDTVPVREEIKG